MDSAVIQEIQSGDLTRASLIGYDGTSVDTFNSGFILFCLLFGRFPFQDATITDDFYKYVANKDYDGFWNLHRDVSGAASEYIKRLIFQILSFDPRLRPTLD